MYRDQLKYCSKCKRILPLICFHKNRSKKDGLSQPCKECFRQYYQDHIEERRQYNNNYSKTHRDVLKKRAQKHHSNQRDVLQRRNKEYYNNNPLKVKAHRSINNAIRDGKLRKPPYCSLCGEIGRIEGHHDDYSKPFEVCWLCKSCHMKLHKQEKLPFVLSTQG